VASRPEVEWDDTERAWMLALEQYRREVLCPKCGYPREICQAPETEFALRVPPPTRCHVETALAQAQKESEHHTPEALIWGVQFDPKTLGG